MVIPDPATLSLHQDRAGGLFTLAFLAGGTMGGSGLG